MSQDCCHDEVETIRDKLVQCLKYNKQINSRYFFLSVWNERKFLKHEDGKGYVK